MRQRVWEHLLDTHAIHPDRPETWTVHMPARSAIGTLLDRSSRYTILLDLPGRHTAEAVRDVLITAFCQLPPRLRRSLTWDQGKEMALHREVTAALGMPVYFCDKASPWQRPSNENTNGLLR
jgi:transposase, IS30 family